MQRLNLEPLSYTTFYDYTIASEQQLWKLFGVPTQKVTFVNLASGCRKDIISYSSNGMVEILYDLSCSMNISYLYLSFMYNSTWIEFVWKFYLENFPSDQFALLQF